MTSLLGLVLLGVGARLIFVLMGNAGRHVCDEHGERTGLLVAVVVACVMTGGMLLLVVGAAP